MKRLLIHVLHALALLCLTASLGFDWFRLPPGANGQPDAAWIQFPAKLVMLQGLVILVSHALIRMKRGVAATGETQSPEAATTPRVRGLLVAVALLLLTATSLTFPGVMRLSDPSLIARATWLQSQHENLTWLGGDIATAYEHSTSGFKNRIIAVDVPGRVLVTTPATWLVLETGPDHFPLLFAELGYNNVFCQFAKRGWFLAVVGSLLLVFVRLFRNGMLDQLRLRRTLICGVLLAANYAIAMLIPNFLAGQNLICARAQTHAGEYKRAIQSLNDANQWLPLLEFNSEFQRQRGLLAWRLRLNDSSRRFFEAIVFEDEGHFAQANEIFEELLLSETIPLPIQREAARALLRSAGHAFNSDRFEQAKRELAIVRRFEPAHVKANYLQQLTALQDRDLSRIETLVAEMQNDYGYFAFPNKKVVLAVCQQHLCYAAMLNHDMPVAWQYFNRYRRP